jgi:hypothetical protein
MAERRRWITEPFSIDVPALHRLNALLIGSLTDAEKQIRSIAEAECESAIAQRTGNEANDHIREFYANRLQERLSRNIVKYSLTQPDQTELDFITIEELIAFVNNNVTRV